MTDPLEISNLVRDVRERLGLTQEQFASRLGVTFPTVNRWENGHSKPSPMAQRLLVEVLKKMGEDGVALIAKYSVIKQG